ncbi:hypothetical protein [Bosea sp. 117]|uniref:hypothetical protein n=1 Tax=Bosea sp. 117 TaxID=1125973 RepID=UPI00049468EF|nr:hypothetical protein [Bosea sp. 117]
MADYYPLLARAISGLPVNSKEARQVVYDRARTALLAQLRGADPPLPEEDVERERRSLDDAMRRIEADYASPAAPPPAPSAPAPRAAAPSPERAAQPNRVPPPAPPAREPLFNRPAPARPPASGPAQDTAPEGDRPGFIRAGLTPRSGEVGREPDEDPMVAPLGSARRGDEPSASEDEGGSWELPDPDDAEARRRRRMRLILALAAVVVLGGATAIGYVQRDPIIAAIRSLRGGETPATPAPQQAAKPESTKSTDRVAQAPSDPARRPTAPSQAPAGQTAAVAQRAVLFEENPGGGQQGLQQFVGTAVWRTETFDAGGGLGPDIGIHATVEIPDRQVKVEITLRRNQDASIPASHIVELQFALPPNFDLGTVANVPGIRAKVTEAAQGLPLAGLAVRVTPGFFLIGLSALDAERQRNLALLLTRNWLDVPIVFSNGRRGILAIEKGLPGDQAFREAFSAWGLPLPPQTPPNQQPQQ